MTALQSFFGTDGIRDVAGKGLLSPDNVVRIGWGLASLLLPQELSSPPARKHRILIAMDTRASGPTIREQLSSSLLEWGIHVHDAGVLPTPGLACLTMAEEYDLGIMISASHNPAKDNGIKIFTREGVKLETAQERAVEHAISSPPVENCKPEEKGRYQSLEQSIDKYITLLVKKRFHDLSLHGLRIVADCANGATFLAAPAILEKLGAKVHAIHTEPNGLNINEECGALHPEQVQKAVLQKKADLGLSFDGDGDRVIFVDGDGAIRDGDHILGCVGLFLSQREKLKDKVIVATSMSNVGLEIFLRKRGIRLLRTEVGDRYIFEEMAKNGYTLGGEPSGHILFRDSQPITGDGIATALTVLKMLGEDGQTLAESCKGIRKAPQILINVPVPVKPPLGEIEEVQQKVRETEEALKGEGRVVLRYSGTEPVVRVMVEGMQEEMVHQKAEEIARLLKTCLSE